MDTPTDIILTDDKPEYRQIFRELLIMFPAITITEATNGAELLELLKTRNPDLVFLDLEMPVMNGKEAFAALREKFPATRVIILSGHYESVLMEDYMDRGARGYVVKDAVIDNPNLLVNAIHKVTDGGTFVCGTPGVEIRYTQRQKELLPLLLEEKTNDRIAEIVGISRRAVEKQRSSIYEKTGSSGTLSFYKYAFTHGLQFLSNPFRKKG